MGEVQSYQPQFGNNFMTGGQSQADRWYDVGVDMIENMQGYILSRWS